VGFGNSVAYSFDFMVFFILFVWCLAFGFADCCWFVWVCVVFACFWDCMDLVLLGLFCVFVLLLVCFGCSYLVVVIWWFVNYAA